MGGSKERARDDRLLLSDGIGKRLRLKVPDGVDVLHREHGEDREGRQVIVGKAVVGHIEPTIAHGGEEFTVVVADAI